MGCPARSHLEAVAPGGSSTSSNKGGQHQHSGQQRYTEVLAPLQTGGAQHSVCELVDESDVLAPLQTRGVQHWMCLSDCHLWEIGELQVKKSPRAFLNGSMHTSVFLVSQYGA